MSSIENQKSCFGFTLLELLIVIIVIGVLASIALPQMFRMVEHSRSAEALSTIGIISRAMEVCGMQFNGNYNNCNNWDSLGMKDPSYHVVTNPSGYFIYSTPGASAPAVYIIVALRTTVDNGNFGDGINFVKYTDGHYAKWGTGAFEGIQ